MRVIDPGHDYELTKYDLEGASDWDRFMIQRVTFMKRVGGNYPGNVDPHPGTNLQECWRMEIHRLQHLDQQKPHPANAAIISMLRQAIYLLEDRAATNHGRKFEPADGPIELLPTCPKCGHIGCDNTCRPHENSPKS